MCFGQTQGRKTVQSFRPPRILTRRTKTASEVTVRFTWSWRFIESRELVRTVPLTSPVQQSPSVLQAELWGLCFLDLACSAAPSRRVNDGRPDSFYDFFLMIFRRRPTTADGQRYVLFTCLQLGATDTWRCRGIHDNIDPDIRGYVSGITWKNDTFYHKPGYHKR